VQVVGPKSTETIRIPEIKTSRTTIQVPIPDAIDREGGSFDIELGQYLGYHPRCCVVCLILVLNSEY
jgi:hypothetical protein